MLLIEESANYTQYASSQLNDQSPLELSEHEINKSEEFYTHQVLNYFADVLYYDYGEMVMSEHTVNFISDNLDFFWQQTDKSIEFLKEQSEQFNVKELNKRPSSFYGKLLNGNLKVYEIYEYDMDDESVLTYIHLLDDEYNDYIILLFADSGDIYEGEIVEFYGTPLGFYYFDNVGGGTTKSQMFIGAAIEKNE